MTGAPVSDSSAVRRVLLIADLEGITGVDRVEQLVFSAKGYPAAARRMTEEVALVSRLLLEHGVRHVRVSDAHLAGGPPGNIDGKELPTGVELRVEEADMYAGTLLDDVDAVACVGMHALGDSPGFGAHTVSVNTAWTLHDEALTETRIVQLLAAERGVPLWFSAGDDVLESQAPAGLPFVRTKRALSRGEARSRSLSEVEADFRAVLKRAPIPPSPLPPSPLRVRFQTRAEATAVKTFPLVSPVEIELPAFDSFQRQFLEACRCIEGTGDALIARIKAEPGTDEFSRAAAQLLLEPWESQHAPA